MKESSPGSDRGGARGGLSWGPPLPSTAALAPSEGEREGVGGLRSLRARWGVALRRPKWSFVDPSVVPSSSSRNRTAGTLHEVLKRNRRARECRLRDHSRDLRQNDRQG